MSAPSPSPSPRSRSPHGHSDSSPFGILSSGNERLNNCKDTAGKCGKDAAGKDSEGSLTVKGGKDVAGNNTGNGTDNNTGNVTDNSIGKGDNNMRRAYVYVTGIDFLAGATLDTQSSRPYQPVGVAPEE